MLIIWGCRTVGRVKKLLEGPTYEVGGDGGIRFMFLPEVVWNC